ncbi:hypothetical protein LTS10_011853 [Elasticomyces elasticus]|nr:hypothetical protein LTS10_011853 [Elasticomyces elasticus]
MPEDLAKKAWQHVSGAYLVLHNVPLAAIEGYANLNQIRAEMSDPWWMLPYQDWWDVDSSSEDEAEHNAYYGQDT